MWRRCGSGPAPSAGRRKGASTFVGCCRCATDLTVELPDPGGASALRIPIVGGADVAAQDTRRIIERAEGAVIGAFQGAPEAVAAGLNRPLDARGRPCLFAAPTDASLMPARLSGVPLLQRPIAVPEPTRLVAGLKSPLSVGSAG